MAGGIGGRLKPLTNIVPKPLIPVQDKTVIEKLLKDFMSKGFEKLFYQ